MTRVIGMLAVALLALGASTAAQSLAAVAREEEQRRKTVQTAGKVYTNGTLTSDITASPPPPTNTSAPAPVPVPPTGVPSVNLPGGKLDPAPVAKDETYWRSRMSAARAALERSRIFADALQSRVNALSAEFVNRDDPVQKGQIEAEKKRALAELERVKLEIGDHTELVARVEEDARKAGVPPGWLR